MASMSRHERALSYIEMLKRASNPWGAAEEIVSSLNSLTWAGRTDRLPASEKIAILEEAEKIVRKGETAPDGSMIVEAGDNSGILDVIDSIKGSVKKG